MGRCSSFHKKVLLPTTENLALMRLFTSVSTALMRISSPENTASAIMKG